MMIRRKIESVAALALALCGAASAEPSQGPMCWTSVDTNGIAAWRARNRAPEALVVSAADRTVRVLLEATGVSEETETEFFCIGPASDRAYESLFVSVATPRQLALAFDRAGFPRGKPQDARASRLWPRGVPLAVRIRPVGAAAWSSVTNVLTDVKAAALGDILNRPVLLTSGARDAKDVPLAETQLPAAWFSSYSFGASILALDGVFDQSATYGRFVARKTLPKGALYEMELAWNGVDPVLEKTVTLTHGADTAALLKTLRADGSGKSLYVKLACAPDVTVREAHDFAQALSLLDGSALRMNGCAPGQFFYRAYLPDESWRVRANRIFQPFELHVRGAADMSLVVVEEDYSGEGSDPVLKPHEHKIARYADVLPILAKAGDEAAKIDVLFVYAPPSTPVATLEPLLAALGSRISTFYVFGE